jgi:hypothetical protein
VDAALREHVNACAACADLAEAASAIGDARDEMSGSVTVPDSARVWWRAQMRARREAVEAAGRPLTAAHVIALACIAGFVGACFGATSAWFQASLQWVRSTGGLFASAAALVVDHGMLVAAMTALILLVPAAVYLATSRD